jgi:DNA-binding NarL/FixJ family response regulator
MRVLIVDDSEELVQRLVAILAAVSGIDIIGRARDVAGATRAVRDLKPDVVILDIRMPGGSGVDVLGGMKNDGSSPTVIVLTNYSHSQYRRKCLQLGARYFFDKSAEFEKVAPVLQGLMHDSSED